MRFDVNSKAILWIIGIGIITVVPTILLFNWYVLPYLPTTTVPSVSAMGNLPEAIPTEDPFTEVTVTPMNSTFTTTDGISMSLVLVNEQGIATLIVNRGTGPTPENYWSNQELQIGGQTKFIVRQNNGEWYLETWSKPTQ